MMQLSSQDHLDTNGFVEGYMIISVKS